VNSKKTDAVSPKLDGDEEEWLTNESNTHSIFQQKSARSSSDEEVFSFQDRLSQSLSQKQDYTNMGDKSDRRISPRNVNNNHSRNSSQSAIANNMTLQGMSKGVKVGLSDLENSYQNIKHKTPVNQTRKSQSGSNTGANSSNSIVEDHIKKVNFAATKIQRWYKRHSARRKAGQAAIQRLLHSKKQVFEEQRLRESQNDFFAKEMEEKKLEERKRNREEKAKIARQEAIRVSCLTNCPRISILRLDFCEFHNIFFQFIFLSTYFNFIIVSIVFLHFVTWHEMKLFLLST
jgi:hypothetical protein